jgi:dTDP-4-amino-4,6-dideoxygalactose transaminase
MQVPFLDLRAQPETIREEVHGAVLSVIDPTRYVMGPEVGALEREIAERVNAIVPVHLFGQVDPQPSRSVPDDVIEKLGALRG